MTYTAHAMHHTLEIRGACRWYDLPINPGPGGGIFGHLLAVGPGLTPWLYTDVWSGPVTIDLQPTEFSPPPSSAHDYDLAIEASALGVGGLFGVCGAEDPPSLLEEHGVHMAPGWLRLRIGALGRGIAYDEAVTTPIEVITVRVWPEPPTPTVDLKTGTQVAPHQPVRARTSGVQVTEEPTTEPHKLDEHAYPDTDPEASLTPGVTHGQVLICSRERACSELRMPSPAPPGTSR